MIDQRPSDTFPEWGPYTARHLASFAHAGQTDKAGEPYIYHPQRVVGRVVEHPLFDSLPAADKGIAIMVAWLHDVIEDTAVTTVVLSHTGCPYEVNYRVRLLTRPKVHSDAGTERYYLGISEDPIALLVKECDIADNADPARLARLDSATQERLARKYAKARAALGLTVAP